ncbi:MAG: InlB B-repeat-containing protein, partial [Bacteroidales bacterium]|nr:InlB B-repeat-containing protein [Bacteroidales bacterium]
SSHVGGILGHGLNSNITIDSCVFAGKIVGGNNAKGVLFGWGDNGGTKVVRTSLYVWQTGQDNTNLDLGKRSGGSESYINCYKTAAVGSYGTVVLADSTNVIAKQYTIYNTHYYIACTVTGVNDAYFYTGEAIAVVPVVQFNGTALSADDYTVTILYDGTPTEEVKARGTYTITVASNKASGYCGKWSKTFTIREKEIYTITYDANGGTGAPEAQTKIEGEDLTLSSIVPVREGYKFMGWSIVADETHEYVDLGLPSGLKWATCNIGATQPEEYGDYFAWGETKAYGEADESNTMNYSYTSSKGSATYVKTYYDYNTYKYCNGRTTLTKYCNNSSWGNNGFTDTLTTLDLADDAARANWGGNWRMPTHAEQEELLTNCTTEWTAVNGVYGRLFTSNINGKTLFLPAAGCCYMARFVDTGSVGSYWSSSLDESRPSFAQYLGFNSRDWGTSGSDRFLGFSVRAVTAFSTYTAGATYSGTGDVTLYAQWEKVYTIAYDANGGTGAPDAQTKIEGEDLTLATAEPTRLGYIFKGWSTLANGTGDSYAAGATYTANAPATLYAQWQHDPWGITAGADGSAEHPYIITTTADLDQLSERVNARNTYEGKHFLLGDDITYNKEVENNYTPIKYFEGTFDGNGKTISGININKPDEIFQGLFGTIEGSAVVKNVNLANSIIVGYSYVGGIAGWNDGTISDCTSSAQLVGGEYCYNFGGIVGKNDDGTISDCISSALLVGGEEGEGFGGIAGYNDGGTLSGNFSIGVTVPAVSKYGAIAGDRDDESSMSNNYYYNFTVAGQSNATDVGCRGRDVTDNDGAVSVHTITLGEGVTLAASASKSYNNTNYYVKGLSVELNYSGTVPEGFVFCGYAVNGEAIEGNSFTMPAADVTVTARWARIYTIAYDANGGTGAPDAQTKIEGEDLTLTTSVPTRPGYKFVGWKASNEAGHDYVDLGLPSGLKWATCNIGANNPEEYGDYFAWGETTGYNSGKTTFDWSTYKYCNGDYDKQTKYCNNRSFGNNGFTDTKTELDLADDAARANWGGSWRMPTHAEQEELVNNCSTTWTTVNGVYGHLFTSNNNGKTLFLPAVGYRDGTSFLDAGSYGYYWSSSLYSGCPYNAWDLYVYPNEVDAFDSFDRSWGFSVRAVTAISNYTAGATYSADADVTLYAQWELSEIAVANKGYNSEIIEAADGKSVKVTLADRTLWCDGDWNTLVLPFEVDLNDENGPLHGAIARKLNSASITGTKLRLNFGNPVETLEAGVPYLIKWEVCTEGTEETEGTELAMENIVNPVFPGVTIDATDRSYDSDEDASVTSDVRVQFLGTYDLKTFNNEDQNILFLGAGNTLYYPDGTAPTTVGACRAYFKLGSEFNAAQLSSYSFIFGDEETVSIENHRLKDETDVWYTLDGRRLNEKPKDGGLYIHQGKKVMSH